MTEFEIALVNFPTIRNALQWQNGDGTIIQYNNWPNDKKQRINEFYVNICNGEADLGFEHYPGFQIHYYYYTREYAFEIYAAHAAHVVYIESHHLVPWSLATRPEAELEVIFSSSSYHSIIVPIPAPSVYYPPDIVAGRDFQATPENSGLEELIGDPRTGFRFMTGETSAGRESLIGNDEIETLVKLTAWMCCNVSHGSIPQDDRVYHLCLENRLCADPEESTQTAFAALGCNSASKLMVDLARSVNIPLLHTRAKYDDSTDDAFLGSDGGLIYGWGGRQPRILWHTDEIYAELGEPCFPIDAHGNLLPPDQAALANFHQRWRTPDQLRGFVYALQKVYPGQGFGAVTRDASKEDRADYGWMSGYWEKKGNSRLYLLARIDQQYELCGSDLIEMFCNNALESQIQIIINTNRGDFTDTELAQLLQMHTLEEYHARIQTALNALGGRNSFNQKRERWNANRGNNLLRLPEDRFRSNNDFAVAAKIRLPKPKDLNPVQKRYTNLSLNGLEKDYFEVSFQCSLRDNNCYDVAKTTFLYMGLLLQVCPPSLGIFSNTRPRCRCNGDSYERRLEIYRSNAYNRGLFISCDGECVISCPSHEFPDKRLYAVLSNPDYNRQGPLEYDIRFSYEPCKVIINGSLLLEGEGVIKLKQYYEAIWHGVPPLGPAGMIISPAELLNGSSILIDDLRSFIKKHMDFISQPEVLQGLQNTRGKQPEAILAAEALSLAQTARAAGLISEAQKLYQQSARLSAKIGQHNKQVNALYGLLGLCVEQGLSEQALRTEKSISAALKKKNWTK